MLKQAITVAKSTIGIPQKIIVRTKAGKRTRLSYKVVEIIGRGTFGLVSKIITPEGTCALKTAYQDKRYSNRELEILRKVEHPSIVGLCSYFFSERSKDGVFLHMCLEYMPMSLGDFMTDKNRCVETIRSLYRQAVEGLSYLHSIGICHRDIKPCNLLVDGQRVKICDFGSAKQLRKGPSVNYVCTRFYRAPENLRAESDYDEKIDVWALGAVFCEFRNEGPMFVGRDAKAVYMAIEQRMGGLKNELIGWFEDEKVVGAIEGSLCIDRKKRLEATKVLSLLL